jgi:GWxTD domain-containing protein
MNSMARFLRFFLIFLATVPLCAALSPNLKEWAEGPVQWIMTAEEQRAWKKVASDSEAVNFIDLFWARRDPTPGTGLNEFRKEFDARVTHADQEYIEKRRRGSMTERGRVFIVLGTATTRGDALRQNNVGVGIDTGGSDPSVSTLMDAREVWIWERADALKYDMPRIEVVFIQNRTSGRYLRDPHRPDFGNAGPVAIKKAIVNPDLTSVPEWAAKGGLHPVAPATALVQTASPALDPAPIVPTPEPKREEGPAVASSEPGASRLTFLEKSWIDVRSATDPFAGPSASAFSSGSDVRWAIQFCAARAETPKLKYALLITGPIGGASKEQATKEKDAKLERMTSAPGCYVLQAALPVAKLAPGRYKLAVLLEEPKTSEVFDVKKEFRIE